MKARERLYRTDDEIIEEIKSKGFEIVSYTEKRTRTNNWYAEIEYLDEENGYFEAIIKCDWWNGHRLYKIDKINYMGPSDMYDNEF